jgi:TonB family protein
MKASIALTVLALVSACVSTPPAQVGGSTDHARNSLTKSSCEVGERVGGSFLSAEQWTASNARYVKLCMKSRGKIFYYAQHDLTQPRKVVGPSPIDYYPASARRLGEAGTAFVSFVVETDGRLSSTALVGPSPFPDLDAAALKWASAARFSSPAYLNSKPVRIYSIFRVVFIQQE